MNQSALTPAQLESWQRDGFLLVPALFSEDEVARLREHFMAMRREASNPASSVRERYAPLSPEQAKGDALKEFPRVLHPHKWDELSKAQMLDARLEAILRELFSDEPLAAQSMFYFKPAGARGQALHQDNFYLNVAPGTCIAAWLAVDDADEENGGMNVVPGSHAGGVRCPRLADMTQSFTAEQVDVPAGCEAVPAKMKAGDVLFFNGSLIHGSTPNTSTNRFRRAFICHYVSGNTTGMSPNYYPLHDFEGNALERGRREGQLNTCGAEDWDSFNRQREAWMRDQAQASGAGVH